MPNMGKLEFGREWQEIILKKLSSRQTVKQRELIRQALDSLMLGISSQPKTIDNKI